MSELTKKKEVEDWAKEFKEGLEYRKKINKEALLDIMSYSSVKESEARLIVAAIARGKIRNIKINY